MTKRVISFLLILVMLTGMLPVFAQAEEPVTSVDSGELTVEGTNDFGNLLAEDIVQAQEEMEEQQNAGYTLTDLQITGNTATVTYDSLEEATVVVALYTEDGMQLLTSGKTTVAPEETTATVTIEGEMPQYFLASAYLLDSYDFSPLCPAYDTPMYTKEMQDLLASTAEDYDPDRVLQLEESPETNFAVYAETTKVIEPVEGYNIVTTADDETGTYVIENADENITSLQVGDVFAYPYDANEVLIVKVGTITVDGTTVTVTSADLELNEAFSHVKIEGVSGTEELTVDDSTAAEGITYEGMIAEGNTARSFTGESTAKLSHKINLEQKIEEETDHLSASASISGSLKFQLAVCVKYYVSLELRYIEFKITPSVVADITIEGKISGKQPLGTFEVSPVPTVKVGFEPKLELTFSGKVSLNCTLSATIGFRYDSEVGLKNISTRPKFTPSLDVEITLFLGIDFGPKVTLLGDDTVKLELSASVGVELKGKAKGTNYEFLTGKETQRHTCKECLEITMTFKAKLSGSIKFFDSEKWKVNVDIGNWSVPLGKAYYSLDHERFGLGTCPYLEYRLTVTVKEAGLTPLSGIAVTTSTGKTLGITNSNGVLVGYLPVGYYRLSVYANEKTINRNITVIGADYISINVPKKSAEDEKDDQEGVLGNDTESDQNASILDSITESDCIENELIDNGMILKSGYDDKMPMVWTLYSNGTLYISGKGKIYSYSNHKGYPWYNYRTSIKRVVIKHGVTSIDDGAFYGCSNLTSIVLPDGLTDIGGYVFYKCSSLIDIVLSDEVSSIGEYAFYGCSSLTDITLPDGVNGIDKYTFYGCSSLTNITLPDGVADIGEYAFYDCSNLTDITLPDGVIGIGEYAFYGCSSLTDIALPDGMISIGERAFSFCRNLTSITFPDELTAMGDAVFWGCSGLTSVTLPDVMTSMGDHVFSYCSSLTSITLPGRITSMGGYVFSYCSSLISIALPDGINNIGHGTFSNCKSLTDVDLPDGIISIGNNAFSGCSSLTNITLPEEVAVIDNYAFNGCSSLDDIMLPDGLAQIGNFAFRKCSNLDNLMLPDELTSIGNYAFSECSSLTYVMLPDRLTSIGDYAFNECSNLTNIMLPDGVTDIGDYTFFGCCSMISVVLPQGLTDIGKSAFNYCSNLADVYYTGTQEQWEAITIGTDTNVCSTRSSIITPQLLLRWQAATPAPAEY